LFLGICIIKSNLIENKNFASRAFFKFQITPKLNALIPIANNLIFIVESKYDKSKITYPLQDNSNDATVFSTTFIYNTKYIRISEKPSGVLLKFEISYPNIIPQTLESSFSPSFPYDPDQQYSFYPQEDKNKIKNLLYAYYHAYYDKEVDLAQELPNHYEIKA
jgi:hypothetical protein